MTTETLDKFQEGWQQWDHIRIAGVTYEEDSGRRCLMIGDQANVCIAVWIDSNGLDRVEVQGGDGVKVYGFGPIEKSPVPEVKDYTKAVVEVRR
ncbi:MAG TPA: hypothetical protein ENK10_06970 [Acidobacteria bacterium]|nr:hypothetical protein [Acidobacteriota bacterium]